MITDLCCGELQRAVDKNIIDLWHTPTLEIPYEIDDGDGRFDTMYESYEIHFCPFCGARLVTLKIPLEPERPEGQRAINTWSGHCHWPGCKSTIILRVGENIQCLWWGIVDGLPFCSEHYLNARMIHGTWLAKQNIQQTKGA